MRKLLPLLLLLFVCGATRASHFNGAEVRYVPEGPKYRVYLLLYKSCEPGSVQLPTASTLNFVSTCGADFSRVLPLVSMDTLHEIFPCAAMVSCGPSTPFNHQIIGTYSDTVSLSPCAAWRMIMNSCCRAASVTNINNPSSVGIYVEAFLNNLNAPNSSARLANVVMPFLGTSAGSTVSLQATDLEGDSMVYELIPAREGAATTPVTATPVPYAMGFTAQQPLGGTTTTLNSSAANISFAANSLQGRFAVGVRIKDYRNGQLVGFTEREWEAKVLFGAPNAAAIPLPANQFQITSCPGQMHNLSLTFTDPNDSVKIVASPDANVSWPVTVTGGNGFGSATINLSWTTPANLNVSSTPYFYIRLKVRDTGCVLGVAWYDVLVRTAYCNTDTVWAGDADANKIVDLYDPLAVALASGKTGAPRPGATQSWTPQTCPNWGTQFLNGVNHKHADCDGNGVVNSMDLNAVTLNYGLTHPRGDDEEQPKTTGLPDLFFDHTGVNAHRGGTVSVPIKLGTPGSAMNNLYGLATRIQIQNVSPTSAVGVSYPTSWLGNGTNTLRFTKATSPQTIDWAYARNGGTNVSGDGTLGTLQIPIPASTPVGTKMILRFLQTRMIDATGAEITAYNVLTDTVTVLAETSVGEVASSVQGALVVPNPSGKTATLMLSSAKAQSVQVSVADAVGRGVWTQTFTTAAGETNIALPSTLSSGLYLIRVAPGDGSAARVVKWVRE